MSEKRLKFLHKNYSRTGRWGWRMGRRIRPIGWGMAMVCTVSAVLGTNVETSGIYMIFCFSACALAMALIWIFCRKAKISGVRSLPEFGSVGQELNYSVEIYNQDHRPLNAMLFEEWPPDPTPAYETFANTPEPGENKRNIVDRTMLYYRWTWIQEQERGYNLLEATQSPHTLKPNEKGRLQFSLIPQNRGVLSFSDLHVLLPDPFGLFQRCPRVKTSNDHIIVLPKRYPLTEFHLPGKAHLHLGGEAASNSVGQTGDFLHLREYRPGDAMRSMDWKSWARTSIPVVREYEDNFFPHYGVVLDTSGPPGPRFEEAVSVASSFVSSMDTQECLLDLLFLGEKSYRLTIGQGVAPRNKLLEALATVKPRKNSDFKALKNLISRESEHLTALLIIFPNWSTERQDFLSELQAEGIKSTVFVIADQKEKENPELKSAAGVHFLHLNSISHDLSLATAQLEL